MFCIQIDYIKERTFDSGLAYMNILIHRDIITIPHEAQRRREDRILFMVKSIIL